MLWVGISQFLEIISLNILITVKEIEEVVEEKILFYKGSIKPRWFYRWMLPKFRGTDHLNIVQTFPDSRKRGNAF